MPEVAETTADKKEHPRGVLGTIWLLEHAQDLVSVVVGVLFFREVRSEILFVLSSEESVMLTGLRAAPA